MVDYIHKSFSAYPYAAYDHKGQELDLSSELTLLSKEIINLADLAQWSLEQDKTLVEDIAAYSDNKPEYAGRVLGVTLPNQYLASRKNTSRLERIFRDMLIRHARSWKERIDAKEELDKREKGDTTNKSHRKYISQGWARTVNTEMPTIGRKISLSAIDSQFATMETSGNVIKLTMTIYDHKITFFFNYDHKRFADCSKITLPDIRVDANNKIHFHFTAAYKYNYHPISTRYVVGVDLGITTPAAVVVWDKQDGRIAHSTTLSRRSHALYNSIKASDDQKMALLNLGRYEEAVPHREASSRKKKELARIIGQEVAEIAYYWDNAMIAVEDLSWIKNTMRNGRWNRGEVVFWIEHYHKLNGGRLARVSAYNTSKLCCYCGSKLSIKNWHDTYCREHGWSDRDINAAANIAKNGIETAEKMAKTRSKSKNLKRKRIKRTPTTKNTLKYPGCATRKDRTKNKPTPQRPKSQKKKHIKEVSLVHKCSPIHSEDVSVMGDHLREAMPQVRTLKKQHENHSYDKLL